MPGSYWECSRCGASNKAFAAVCFTCGGNTRKPAAPPPPDPERLSLTPGQRVLVAAGLAVSALMGYAMVRTFRSPALERAAAEEPAAESGRDPLPPDATMPGAPDSGWPPSAGGVKPAQPTPTSPVSSGVIASVPATVPAQVRPRAYTEADLRLLIATRGVAATHDRGYVLALRQRRVDDLRERLVEARAPEERAKLQEWLDAALNDLERARR